MHIRMYQATDGDCLLITSTGSLGSRMLIDGGRKASFREHTASDLAGPDFDLVVVSHIDNDHISGIVELFDQIVAWRVYRIHEDRLASDEPTLTAAEKTRRRRELKRLLPNQPEPPGVLEVWHNAFSDQVNFGGGSVAAGPVSRSPLSQSQLDEMLASAVRMQLLDRRFEEDLEDTANLAQGVKEAVILRNRLSAGQLDIPINAQAKGDTLFYLADSSGKGSVETAPIEVGDFSIRILGPSRDDLERLKDEWDEWMSDNATIAKQLREEAQRESERLDAGLTSSFGSVLENLALRLGDGSSVTPPNLASLLMYVEQGGHTVLLTGDGIASEIVRGLRVHGLLAPAELPAGAPADDPLPARCHVDVLKIPHHGATDNVSEGFFTLVTADHYLFCGNGAHSNPELAVIEMLLDERSAAGLGDYHLWFSSSDSAANTDSRREHMARVRETVSGVSGVTAHFLESIEADPEEAIEDPDLEGFSYASIDLDA